MSKPYEEKNLYERAHFHANCAAGDMSTRWPVLTEAIAQLVYDAYMMGFEEDQAEAYGNRIPEED